MDTHTQVCSCIRVYRYMFYVWIGDLHLTNNFVHWNFSFTEYFILQFFLLPIASVPTTAANFICFHSSFCATASGIWCVYVCKYVYVCLLMNLCVTMAVYDYIHLLTYVYIWEYRGVYVPVHIYVYVSMQ